MLYLTKLLRGRGFGLVGSSVMKIEVMDKNKPETLARRKRVRAAFQAFTLDHFGTHSFHFGKELKFVKTETTM